MLPDIPWPGLQAAWCQAVRALLSERTGNGHWLGELSNSALATATAVTALALVQRQLPQPAFSDPIQRGLSWLSQHPNADGGWGDTTQSRSNLSTTTLCWAAFGAAPATNDVFGHAVHGAENWILQRVGSLQPDRLAPALIQRYGKDRTFSVPILTMCALAGRLGSGRAAWRHVIPLPFELAVFPRSWFAALRLPVVSYALPALIAIGQARFHHGPPANPILRMFRRLARTRSLRVLEAIQPANGGFLEAIPLTSFVTMSLASVGLADQPVARRGVTFLLQSQRPDGSWPIDTNLATWLTTLSVQALGRECLSQTTAAQQIRPWLLAQQFQHRHPYTNAAPGGWAWTDLPGAVPDADDTAGALLALNQLGEPDPAVRQAAQAGLDWLGRLQNRDGGIPTFCRGWGALPFDRSSPDLTAHALRAWISWLPALPPSHRPPLRHAIRRAVAFLARTQRPDGSWIPLWFGNQLVAQEENPTYGTARVLTALATMAADPTQGSVAPPGLSEKAVAWLVQAQNSDGGWGGAAQVASSVEETGLAVEALAAAYEGLPATRARIRPALQQGVAWLMDKVESGGWTHPAPIGFYFAKLWYYEKLYPQVFTVGALRAVLRLCNPRAP